MPGFELQACNEGTFSLVDLRVGEAMHSSIGPYQEAQLLYIGQSDLAARLSRPESSPLTIYDVGLGIATNAIAAIDFHRDLRPVRGLEIHSFENNLAGLATALASPEAFPFLRPHHDTLERLLRDRSWISENERIRWTLHEGDFRQVKLPEACPELVFFDFFSPRVAPELWDVSVFSKLRETCLPSAPGTTLITYCAAKSARFAMHQAGFIVGVGAGTAKKKESTIASNLKENVALPLADTRLTAPGPRS